MWFVFAVESAVFVALISILIKIGIEEINSSLETGVLWLYID